MTTNDRHRPRYHFTAPQNWMNDPNGLVEWDGRYHLFYQHNPNAAYWGDMHWGHAITTDWLTWEHLPLALYPDAEYDRDGAYSGAAVILGDEVAFMYTGVRGTNELPCLAFASDPDLRTLRKDARNPLFHPPTDLDITIFRDHAPLRHGDGWIQVIGSGIVGEGGNGMLYRSADFLTWEFVGPLVSTGDHPGKDAGATGWECPDFFNLGDTYAVVISRWATDPIDVFAYTGSFDGVHFVPTGGVQMDAGDSFYAPQSFPDSRGRRIQLGWLRETRPTAHSVADGWSGAMSLPREMILRADGTLGSRVLPELMDTIGWIAASVDDDGTVDTGAIDATSCVVRVGDAANGFALDVRRSARGDETTRIEVNAVGELVIDTTRSSANDDVPGTRIVMPLQHPEDCLVFIDRSVIEVYCDDRSATVRVYPEGDDADGIVFRGGSLEIGTFA